jgi:hypothetical protein
MKSRPSPAIEERLKHNPEISVGEVEFSKPPTPDEVFYRITLVPGNIANCAVEEIVVQCGQIVRRGIISDRDNRLGAEARLLALMSRRNGTSR